MSLDTKIFLYAPSGVDAKRLGWECWFDYLKQLSQTIEVSSVQDLEGPGCFVSFSPIETHGDCYPDLEGKLPRVLAIESGEGFRRNQLIAIENNVERILYPPNVQPMSMGYRVGLSVWDRLHQLPVNFASNQDSKTPKSSKIAVIHKRGVFSCASGRYDKVSLFDLKEHLNCHLESSSIGIDWLSFDNIHDPIELYSYQKVVFDINVSMIEVGHLVVSLLNRNTPVLSNFEIDVLDSLLFGHLICDNLSVWEKPNEGFSLRDLTSEFVQFVNNPGSQGVDLQSKSDNRIAVVEDYSYRCLTYQKIESDNALGVSSILENDFEFERLIEWLQRTYRHRPNGYELVSMLAANGFFHRFTPHEIALNSDLFEKYHSLIEKLKRLVSLDLSRLKVGGGYSASTLFSCWFQLLLTEGNEGVDRLMLMKNAKQTAQPWLLNQIELVFFLKIAYDDPRSLEPLNDVISGCIPGNQRIDLKHPHISAWSFLTGDLKRVVREVRMVDDTDFKTLPLYRIVGRLVSSYLCSESSFREAVRSDCLEHLERLGLLKYSRVESFFSQDIS